MAGAVDVLVRFVGDASSVQKEVDKVDGSGGKLKGTMAKVGAAIAAGFAVKAIGDFVNAASDLNESMSKTEVVFGKASKGVVSFAETAATSMGLSKQEALEATATFGNLFTAMGQGQKEAAGTSKHLVKLAGDLASFNNVPVADALAALKSGLVGETEPLRAFGVNINQARLEAKALQLGLATAPVDMDKLKIATENAALAQAKATKATKEHGAQSEEAKRANLALEKATNGVEKAMAGGKVELDANAKAQAAYALIMDDTKTAQGDFARTSDGVANQQRIMEAQWKDTQATLGQALLPLVKDFTKVLNDTLIPAIKKLSESGLLPWLLGAAAAIWAVNIALDANPIILITLAIVAFIAVIALLWQNWDQVWTWIMDHKAYALIIAWILPIGAAIVALVGIAKWLFQNWDSIWNGIKAVVGAVVGWIVDRWNNFTSIFGGVVAIIGRNVSQAIAYFNTIKDAVTAVYDWVKDKIGGIVGLIDGILAGVRRAVGSVVNAIKAPINAVIRGWNGIEFKVPEVSFLGQHLGGNTIKFPNLPELAKGGYVSGTGLAVVHRGETFSGVGNTMGTTINLNVSVGPGVDPAQTGRTLVEYLRAYERANGRQVLAS